MGTNDIAIQIFQNPAEAPNYNTNGSGFKGAIIKKAVIVKNGTESGNATIDIQFVDENGQTYVGMITARLLQTVLAAAGYA